MNRSKIPCDENRLRLLLANQLPLGMERDAADHVAACPDCKQKLEALAGDGDWWSSVKACFVQNEDRMSASRSGSSDQFPATVAELEAEQDAAPEHAGDAESFEADFVVDFLQPCDQPGRLGRLDEFEIEKVIGRGGMAIVLKGYQRELGRHVAVKVMTPRLAISGAARARFAREARAAAAIVHPHVMAIHSINAASRLPYLVMPYVACESLQQRIDRDGPLEPKEVLRIGLQVASGLAAAHAQGLVHRDVKPANILLEKSVERVMLTDFGLARAVDDASLTRTGVIAGTPQYMSPEQARGESVDQRSDLFSLGGVMYAMCTARPPFRGETSYGVLRRITDTEPRPIREIHPEIPEWLERIVQQLLAKSREERLQSADEVATLLQRCLAHLQQPTQVELPTQFRTVPPEKRVVTQRYIFAAVAAVVLLLVVLIFSIAMPHATSDIRSADQLAEERVAGETAETDAPTITGSTTAMNAEATDTDWDASSRLLQSYEQEFGEFESATRQTWKNQPHSTTE